MNQLRKWAWESGWLVLGVAAWVIAPWVGAWLTVPGLGETLATAPAASLFWSYLFGVLWGIGGLTFGLTMRYLGLSLGMAVALGLTAAFGTLVPPIYDGTFMELFAERAGVITLLGVLICLLGIGVCGYAGIRKERELGAEEKTAGVKEFNLSKGVTVAVVAGILSACFAFGLRAGEPIAAAAVAGGARALFQNNASLVVILAGGMTTNALYCLYLNVRNKSYRDYTDREAPLAKNYVWAALGGVTWYFQFFFYGMGETLLGEEYAFASWTLHMAFIILFSNVWGLYFREWRGVSTGTYRTVATGLGIIVLSTVLIGMAGKF